VGVRVRLLRVVALGVDAGNPLNVTGVPEVVTPLLTTLTESVMMPVEADPRFPVAWIGVINAEEVQFVFVFTSKAATVFDKIFLTVPFE
jgi:hypothetical protein